MEYSIDPFWLARFAPVREQALAAALPGWQAKPDHSPSFVEAALSLRADFSDISQSIWLVAAPGAVGKSTLAREICSATNAVYLDLATAATVAGNYLVGGLVKTGLWSAWQAGESTLLVDALDEARLRVTQSSFEDFLADVANVAGTRNVPIVLLGRVGIVEEAWSILNERSPSDRGGTSTIRCKTRGMREIEPNRNHPAKVTASGCRKAGIPERPQVRRSRPSGTRRLMSANGAEH